MPEPRKYVRAKCERFFELFVSGVRMLRSDVFKKKTLT